jgi:hypothetical protein
MSEAHQSAFADLTFWPTSWKGAIAQLGERVLCKHEVVGSIPSGSTRRRLPSLGFQPPAYTGHRPKTRFRFRAHGSLPLRTERGLSYIVKRKYIRLVRRFAGQALQSGGVA